VQAIRGERDPIFSEAAWKKLERVRPDWHYVELSEIGHVPQLEAPREVAGCLLDWLKGDAPVRQRLRHGAER
jgi:pimeloyl-ACP methyl ester carboxylesterase